MRFVVSLPRVALITWLVILLAISIRVAFNPKTSSVLPVFTEAAQHWLDGEDIYLAAYSPYRYSPLVALCFLPFHYLPASVGGVVWRLLNAGLYLGALVGWFRHAPERSPTNVQMAVLFLLVAPVSVGSLNNGQSNALVLGLLLIAIQAVGTSRWNLASGCLTVGCLFKVYPIALAALLIILYPRQLAPRFAVAVVLGLALPFAFASPEYVTRQYWLWIHDLRTDDRSMFDPDYWYRDIRLLLHEFHFTVQPLAYLVFEVVVGALMALYVGYLRFMRCESRGLQRIVFTLGCCWMTVFGPASESCSYIYLAPSLAWYLFDTWREPGFDLPRVGILLGNLLFLVTSIAAWFPGGRHLIHSHGLHALAGLIFLISWLLSESLTRLRPQEDGEFSLVGLK